LDSRLRATAPAEMAEHYERGMVPIIFAPCAALLLGICYGVVRRKDESAFSTALSTRLVGVGIILFFGLFDLLGW